MTVVASGGAESVSGGYKIHKFTGDGTFIVTSAGDVEVLVVAGGGAGAGRYHGAGGGGGGVLYEAVHALITQEYSIIIGNGGVGANSAKGTNGGDSVFDTLTAKGGGAGGRENDQNGSNGGCGGGSFRGTVGTGIVGPPRQGYNGGTTTGAGYGSGGGGGSAAVGGDGLGSIAGGKGGDGISSEISGTHAHYGGGGGGACYGGTSGAGGEGGGGRGGNSDSQNPVAGTVNTGGGGGGCERYSIQMGGAGGSGIVIIRYLLSTSIEESTTHSAGINIAMTPLRLADLLTPKAGVKAMFTGDRIADDLPASAGVKALFEGYGAYTTGMQADTGVQAVMAGNFETISTMAITAGMAADFDGFNWSDFLRVYRDRISIRYILTLSDGILDDIVIPISSFQGRFRTGDPTFLSVVIPGNDQYADIAARDAGDLILTMQYLVGGVVFHSEVICTVDLEDIRIDEGTSSVSVTLSGHRTVTNTTKTTQLFGASYKAVYDGKIRYRCTPDLYLLPGDTVTVGDDTFTAGVITWMVDPSQQTMEVEEA